jgi:hypothetical protein
MAKRIVAMSIQTLRYWPRGKDRAARRSGVSLSAASGGP